MKKTYITPATQCIEMNLESQLLTASFVDGKGSIGKDDNGSYTGEDALSREENSHNSDIWSQGW